MATRLAAYSALAGIFLWAGVFQGLHLQSYAAGSPPVLTGQHHHHHHRRLTADRQDEEREASEGDDRVSHRVASFSSFSSSSSSSSSSHKPCVQVSILMHNTELWAQERADPSQAARSHSFGSCPHSSRPLLFHGEEVDVGGIPHCLSARRVGRADSFGASSIPPNGSNGAGTADIIVILHALICLSRDSLISLILGIHRGAHITTCSIVSAGKVISSGVDVSRPAPTEQSREEGGSGYGFLPRLHGSESRRLDVMSRGAFSPAALPDPGCLAVWTARGITEGSPAHSVGIRRATHLHAALRNTLQEEVSRHDLYAALLTSSALHSRGGAPHDPPSPPPGSGGGSQPYPRHTRFTASPPREGVPVGVEDEPLFQGLHNDTATLGDMEEADGPIPYLAKLDGVGGMGLPDALLPLLGWIRGGGGGDVTHQRPHPSCVTWGLADSPLGGVFRDAVSSVASGEALVADSEAALSDLSATLRGHRKELLKIHLRLQRSGSGARGVGALRDVTDRAVRDLGDLFSRVAGMREKSLDPDFITPRRGQGPDPVRGSHIARVSHLSDHAQYEAAAAALPAASQEMVADFETRWKSISRTGVIDWGAISLRLATSAWHTSCTAYLFSLPAAAQSLAHLHRRLPPPDRVGHHLAPLLRACEGILPAVVVPGGAVASWRGGGLQEIHSHHQAQGQSQPHRYTPYVALDAPGALGAAMPQGGDIPPLAGLEKPRRGAAAPRWRGVTVAWVLPCCKCCGFVNEAVDLLAGLAERGVPVRLTTPPGDCLCDAFPAHIGEMMDNLYINGSALARLSRSPLPSGRGSRKVILMTHGVPQDFHAMWAYAGLNLTAGDLNSMFIIGRAMYEFTVVPEPFSAMLEEWTHEVWVPSTFVQGMLQENLISKTTRVLWEAVDTLRYHTGRWSEEAGGLGGPDLGCALPPRSVPKENCLAYGAESNPGDFKFLSMFKWEDRKGWDILLEGFLTAFNSSEGVSLYISTIPHKGPHASRRNITDAVASVVQRVMLAKFPQGGGGGSAKMLPHVTIMHSKIPDGVVPLMYASADAFVLPTRGEGWGLPVIQAMAAGLPTIATNWSGPVDFMTDRTAYPLRFVEEEVPANSYYGWASGKRWAQPDKAHLVSLMRKVRYGPSRGVGAAAADDVCF